MKICRNTTHGTLPSILKGKYTHTKILTENRWKNKPKVLLETLTYGGEESRTEGWDESKILQMNLVFQSFGTHDHVNV